jgi:hypothetical protein
MFTGGRAGSPGSALPRAALLLALSLDDLASFHEKLHRLGRSMGGQTGFFYFAWVIPGLFLAVGCILVFAFHALSLRERARAYLITGVGLFFLGALGVEMIGGADLAAKGRTDSYVLLYHFEEMLEAMGAALILASALADLPPEERVLFRKPR